MRGVGEEHDKAVDAKGNAGARGKMVEGVKKGFVEGIDFASEGGAFALALFEARALRRGVGEFGVGVGEFDAEKVEFPTRGGESVGIETRQRGGGRGIIGDDNGRGGGGKGGFDDTRHVEVEAVGVPVLHGVPTGVATVEA